MDSARPGRLPIVLAFLSIYLIWGSTYLAIRFAIETMPPFLMAGVRWIVPGAALLAWARLRDKAPWPEPIELRSTAIVGILLLVGGNGIVSWAEQWVPSGLTALLIASVPLWMAFLQWAGAKARGRTHRMSPLAAVGLAIGFVGVGALVGAPAPTEAAADPHALMGSIALLAASLLWASGSLYSRGAALPKSPVMTIGCEMLWGGAALLLLGTLTGEWARVDAAAVSAKSLAALAFLILFGSILGFSAYVWLLRVVAPSKVATYAYVNPVVAVLLGWLFAGEPITGRILAAACVVVGSVVLITTARG